MDWQDVLCLILRLYSLCYQYAASQHCFNIYAVKKLLPSQPLLLINGVGVLAQALECKTTATKTNKQKTHLESERILATSSYSLGAREDYRFRFSRKCFFTLDYVLNMLTSCIGEKILYLKL